MPADNIARAVKRGAGAEDGAANYEDIVYEGYAPAGVGSSSNALPTTATVRPPKSVPP